MELVKNATEYQGMYVTTPTSINRRVISSSKIPLDAMNKAKEKGYPNPVIIYVPYSDAYRVTHHRVTPIDNADQK